MHHALAGLHKLVVGAGQEKWMAVGGKDFDIYDVSAFFYGWIVALQDGFKGDSASNCFYSAFALVEQSDFWLQEYAAIQKTWDFYTLLVFRPTHIWGNFSASYE